MNELLQKLKVVNAQVKELQEVWYYSYFRFIFYLFSTEKPQESPAEATSRTN